jgi:hypothetical protein
MKYFIFSFCLLCGLAPATALAQLASIGINTENPKGVLHIDGASTTATTNPQTGTISAVQASDDVVIDADGRIGVGIQDPAVKVDIYTSGTGGALRIQDGTQGARKVLTSMADGAATWTMAPGSWWYAALYESVYVGRTNSVVIGTYPIISYASSLVSTTGEGSVNAAAGTITVPFTGRYRIMLSIHCISRAASPYWGKVILQVTHSGVKTDRWSPSVWGVQQGYGTRFTPSVVLELDEGDVLNLALDSTRSNNAHYAHSGVFLVEFIP